MPTKVKRTTNVIEAKLRVDEAAVHVKSENYNEAMLLYNQVNKYNRKNNKNNIVNVLISEQGKILKIERQ